LDNIIMLLRVLCLITIYMQALLSLASFILILYVLVMILIIFPLKISG